MSSNRELIWSVHARGLDDPTGEVRNVDLLALEHELAGLDLAREQDVVDQMHEPLGLVRDDGKDAAAHIVGEVDVLALECLRRPVNGGDRRSQLVGDGGDEIGLELIQSPLLGEIAERVDGPFGEVDPGDRKPELATVDLDGKRRGRARVRSGRARDRDGSRKRPPAGNRYVDLASEHRLGRHACDCLGGRVPELNGAAGVDEEHAVGDVSEHPGGLSALLGFPIQPSRDALQADESVSRGLGLLSRRMLTFQEGVALLSKADPFQRVFEALSHRLEQGHLPLVEALVVEACDADHAAVDLAGERHDTERSDSDPEQIGLVQLRLPIRQGPREAFVVQEDGTLVARQTVGTDEGGGSAVTRRQDERDLGFERLAQLCGEELAQFCLRPREVDDRDDLRAPRRLDEAPKQLVALLESVQPSATTTRLKFRSPFAPRTRPISPRV